MRKVIMLFSLFSLLFSLIGCDLVGGSSNVEKYDNELESSTGKWILLSDADTYFIFDGSNDVMSFSYFEDGVSKYNGSYMVLYKGVGDKVLTPLTFVFTRSDKTKEDWLGCYVDDFKTDFTQFTVMDIEEDLGMISGNIYTHIYRISELPYKLGTYILEGNDYKVEADDYASKDNLYIPTGTYTLETGESFTFISIKPRYQELFQYRNGDVVIEGTFTLADDQKNIYLYIEHDPYSKVTKADKDKYDTTFDMNYPPDFYLRGDFSNSEYIEINSLYHHTNSPTKIEDSIWTFGKYVLQK